MTSTISLRTLLALAVVLTTLCLGSSASATPPSQIALEGLLTDLDGVPLEGEQTLTFRLYASAEGGASVFDESQQVTLERGHFVVYLPAPLVLFRDHDALYVGVSRDGEAEMSPRMALATVPWAASSEHCVEADTVSGLSAVATSGAFADLTGVPVDLLDGDDDDDTLGGLTCAPGDIPGWTGSNWTCVANTDADTLAALVCATGQTPRWSGSAWVCDDFWLDASGNATVPGALTAESVAVTGTKTTVRAGRSSVSIDGNPFLSRDWADCGDKPVTGVRLVDFFQGATHHWDLEVRCGP